MVCRQSSDSAKCGGHLWAETGQSHVYDFVRWWCEGVRAVMMGVGAVTMVRVEEMIRGTIVMWGFFFKVM